MPGCIGPYYTYLRILVYCFRFPNRYTNEQFFTANPQNYFQLKTLHQLALKLGLVLSEKSTACNSFTVSVGKIAVEWALIYFKYFVIGILRFYTDKSMIIVKYMEKNKDLRIQFLAVIRTRNFFFWHQQIQAFISSNYLQVENNYSTFLLKSKTRISILNILSYFFLYS